MLKLGPFELEELLGKGGMGEVWRGYHASQQIPVAIKVILREGSTHPEYLEAFSKEVQAMALLDHPSIITVLDYGLIPAQFSAQSDNYFIEGSPYLVMELAEDGSLQEWMHQLAWPQIQAVLFTVLDALAHAHGAGVIHRDLKPQNLLMSHGLASPLKLTDFGLSHAVHEEQTRDGRFEPVWGTPNYMAPEQIRGSWRDYGPWTDLYALGCMAFELVTGRVPFTGQSPQDLWGAHLAKEIPRWVPRVEVPPALERWVLRLLQKEPRQRYERAADAAFALAGICGMRTENALLSGQEALRRVVMTQSKELLPGSLAMLQTDVDLEAPTRAGAAPPQHTPHITVIPSLAALDWSSRGEVEQLDLTQEDPTQEAKLEPWPKLKPPFPTTWRQNQGSPINYRLLGTGLHLHRLRQLRLVNREQERDALWELLKTCYVLGQPQVVILKGPAGVGKTRLAHWMGARAHELGAAEPLHGSYSQLPNPYDGIVPMFARHAQTLGLTHKDALVRLAHYLKLHSSKDPQHFKNMGDVLLEHDPEYLFSKGLNRAAISSIQRHQTLLDHMLLLASHRGLYIHLDDVHWGAEALLFLRHIMRQRDTSMLPALFVLCVRQEELDKTSLERQLLDELAALPMAQTLELPALETQDFAQLVQNILPLSPELTRQVEQRAHGNPLFAIELIGTWIDQNRLEDHEEGYTLHEAHSLDIPDDIHALMQEQLLRHDDALSLPLMMAAALGTEIREHEWLKAMSIYQDDLPLFVRAQITNTEVLRPAGRQGWSFAHNMMRESLVRQAHEEHRWVGLNLACAQMLQELYPHMGAHQERLAIHLLEAGLVREALGPLAQAAERRRRRCELPRAHRLLDQLMELSQPLHSDILPEAIVRGHLTRARCHDMQGHYMRAIEAAQTAHELAKDISERELSVEASLVLGWATLHCGQTPEAELWFELAQHSSHDKPEYSALHRESIMGQARVAQRRGQLDLSSTLFEQAMASAKEEEHHEHRSICLNGLGDLARQGGRLAEAASFSERSLKLARMMGNRLLMADCKADLAELYRLRGEYARAQEMGQRAIAILDSIESELSLRVKLEMTFNALARGHWPEAQEQLKGLTDRFRKLDDRGQLPLAMAAEAAILAYNQQWAQMHNLLNELAPLLERSQRLDVDVALCARLIIEQLPEQGFEATRQRLLALEQHHRAHTMS